MKILTISKPKSPRNTYFYTTTQTSKTYTSYLNAAKRLNLNRQILLLVEYLTLKKIIIYTRTYCTGAKRIDYS
jgi:hypothetical protein